MIGHWMEHGPDRGKTLNFKEQQVKHCEQVLYVYRYGVPELRTKGTAPKYPDSLDEARDFLQQNYLIDETHSTYVKETLGFDPLEWDREEEKTKGNFFEAIFDLQFTFAESEMVNGEKPTDQALENLEDELTEYLATKYEVRNLEVLDDTLSSRLVDVWEDEGEDGSRAAKSRGGHSP